MNRRDFLASSAAATLAAGFLPAPTLALQPVETKPTDPKPAPAKAPPAPFRIACAPVLQHPADDGMTVVFPVTGKSTAWVEYGETEALGRSACSSEHGLKRLHDRVHKIRIAGLKPSTRYFYRAYAAPIDFRGPYDIRRLEAVQSPVYSFTTLDSGKSAVTTFSVINDTHETRDTLAGVTARLAAAGTDLTFWNGDVFNDIRSDQQIVDQFLSPAGAPFATSSPLVLVKGNHDVRGVAARVFEQYTDSPGGLCYSIVRRGPVAFLIMDTGEDKPDDHKVYGGLNDFAAYRTVQRAWLEKAITDPAFASAPYRVAMMHIPLVGDGASIDSRDKWHDLLVKGRVQLIISGHIHKYSYSEPDTQRPYGQLIGGGPKPEAATFIRGKADQSGLEVVMTDLGGKELGVYRFKA